MFTLNCNGRLLIIDKPIVMGVINVTPDSFYKKSSLQTVDEALRQAEKMRAEGATILDIGGQSTRPRSIRISAEEEMKRVIPVVEAINKNFPETYISIDTYNAEVAKNAVTAGACIINDISGGTMDKKMLSTAGGLN